MSFQAYIGNIKTKKGKQLADFKNLVDKEGLLKEAVYASEIVQWLKQNFDLAIEMLWSFMQLLKEEKSNKIQRSF